MRNSAEEKGTSIASRTVQRLRSLKQITRTECLRPIVCWPSTMISFKRYSVYPQSCKGICEWSVGFDKEHFALRAVCSSQLRTARLSQTPALANHLRLALGSTSTLHIPTVILSEWGAWKPPKHSTQDFQEYLALVSSLRRKNEIASIYYCAGFNSTWNFNILNADNTWYQPAFEILATTGVSSSESSTAER